MAGQTKVSLFQGPKRNQLLVHICQKNIMCVLVLVLYYTKKMTLNFQ